MPVKEAGGHLLVVVSHERNHLQHCLYNVGRHMIHRIGFPGEPIYSIIMIYINEYKRTPSVS